jgi:hypothetical protein
VGTRILFDHELLRLIRGNSMQHSRSLCLAFNYASWIAISFKGFTVALQ